MNRRRLKWVSSTLLLAAAAVGAFVIPSITSAHSFTAKNRRHTLRAGALTRRSDVSLRVGRPSRLVLRRFALLRSTRAASAVPPAIVDLAASDRHSSIFGIDPAAARMVVLPGSVDVWLVPGARGSCLMVSIPDNGEGGGCQVNTSSRGWGVTQSGSVEWTFNNANDEMAIGVVPDGSRIEFQTASGSTVTPAIVDNAFEATAPAGDEFDAVTVVSGTTTVWSRRVPAINPDGP